MKKILALSLFDLKYAYRDFMLMVSILAPLLLALIFRFGIPFIFSYLEGRFSITLKRLFRITSHHPYDHSASLTWDVCSVHHFR